MTLHQIIEQLVEMGWNGFPYLVKGKTVYMDPKTIGIPKETSLADIICDHKAMKLWFGEKATCVFCGRDYPDFECGPRYRYLGCHPKENWDHRQSACKYHLQQLILLESDEEKIKYLEDNKIS